MTQSNWKIGLPLALTTAFMWAMLPIALKGLLDDITATTATWYRFVGAAVLAGGYYGWSRQLNLRQLFGRALLPFTLLAVAGLLTNYLTYATGLNHITAGAAQIVIQLAPLMLLISSVLWLGEHFSPRQWLGVMMVTIGLPLFFNQRLPELVSGANREYLIGLGFIVVAAVGWAIYGFYQKKILSRAYPQDLLVLIYLTGTLCFLPMADPLSVAGLDWLGWALLIFLTANTLIAYGAFSKALANWEASRVSATLALVPLLTLALSALIGAVWPDYIEVEPLNWISWLGAAAVVCGSLFAAIGRGR
ncbi:EamA domain-containing membrane protein RarD [Microbulbifer donghaiensis]|uniref:EamA domain-containing membrane protein RarD n=1 Tax=Microbulbifer donghaiensis TaxID=494016 RepID=A0A1M4Y5V9_9GAMM|nr:DMT family transporter [Microbulbifer donghaiensis]SHF01098.1 EamA domain-containing membrane protein RarD [Microbulbifer donghaiensis]